MNLPVELIDPVHIMLDFEKIKLEVVVFWLQTPVETEATVAGFMDPETTVRLKDF